MRAIAAQVLINIPLVIIGFRNYNVLQLFLLTNMLCVSCCLPVLIGGPPRHATACARTRAWAGARAWACVCLRARQCVRVNTRACVRACVRA